MTEAWAAERVLLSPAGQSAAGQALAASPTVKALRATAAQAGAVKVIVGLRVPFAPAADLAPAAVAQQRAEIAGTSAAVRGRFAAAIARAPNSFRAFNSVPFVALEVTPAELDRLASDPAVISITENGVLRLNLAESAQLIRAPEAWASGYTGAGQTIAIIDSGIDKFHFFLGGRVVSEACYTIGQCPGGSNSSTAPGSGLPCTGSTECDHGTHVAGIAAGYLSSAFSGIAPRAGIISIKVLAVSGGEALTSFADIDAALERVHELRNSFNIAAVNLSLGSVDKRYSDSCDEDYPSTAALINQLKADGIATVVASGNDGDPRAMSAPACLSNAISVGSVSDSDWGVCSLDGITGATTAADKVACYSNASPSLSLLAPGSAITSSMPGGDFAIKHGTSMAAPHVAGAVAVLRAKARGAGVDDLLGVLRDTGKPVTDYRNGSITTPRIDVKAAVDALDTNTGLMALTLLVNGNGRGQVTIDPASGPSSCSDDCVSYFSKGRVVTLTARSGAGSFFAGWTGACSGMGGCTVTMDSAKKVFAVFYAITSGTPTELTFGTSGGGQGTVTILANGQEITCSGTCSHSLGKNAMVKLTATPAYGAALTSWTGACRGRKSTCVVRLKSPRAAFANFEALPMHDLVYSKGGVAGGTVSISTTGRSLTCSSDCTTPLPYGTRVRLVAIPDAGKKFSGWQGICKGRKTSCSFTLKGSFSVSAAFN